VLITSITGCCSKLKELGSGYFNPVTNPKGAIAFDRFAATSPVSGFSEDKVFKAAEKGFVVRCCP